MADRRARLHDDGFTLIEVMIALGIFVVMVTSLLPMFAGGIRSVSTADREGVVKGLLQQEVERLRGLPYRVSLGTNVTSAGTDRTSTSSISTTRPSAMWPRRAWSARGLLASR